MSKISLSTAMFYALLSIVLTSISSGIQAVPPDAPYNLRTCDLISPSGTGQNPHFGWYINDPDDDEIQRAFQILVFGNLNDLETGKGIIWDSGKISSRNQNYIYYNGPSLLPATTYYWKVRTWDKDDQAGPYSSSAHFDTGLFSNSDWAGSKWIKRDSNDPDDYTYFRKEARLPEKPILKATLYISACHDYEFFVNETFIGKGSFHHYPPYSYYHAWDITQTLKTGSENVLACQTHWYGGGQGRAKGSRGLLMKAIILYTDSSTVTICSDSSWIQTRARQWIPGQAQRNGEGIGRIEWIDSRLIQPGWNSLHVDVSGWQPAAEIGPHPVSPWTGTLRPDLTRLIEEEIKPASVSDLGKGCYVIDLGKIYPGRFKIAFSGGHEGDTIRMTGGFVLNDDGTVSKKINQHTKLDFLFIHNGRTAEFCPGVYLGLRYLQVNNSPNPLTTKNVRFIARHYDLDPGRSSFSSSNPMLNQVWDLMTHSLLAGAQDGFVDTPTREKGTFLGDSWSQAIPALSVTGDRTLNLRVLREFLDSQDQYWPDGRLNAVYPNVDGARDIPDYTQSFLVWVWDYYLSTGNKAFLAENYTRLKKVAGYVDTYTDQRTGLIHKLKGGKGPYEFGIIDWPDNMRYGYDMSVETRTVIDAYAYACFDRLSLIADEIGNQTDMALYRGKAESIRKAINKWLINQDGVYIDGLMADLTPSQHVSQHANVFPFAMGLVPEANVNPVIAEILNRKMNMGMVTLRWLPEAIGKADQGPHLIDLYTNTEWDGWAKTIQLGGTVTWESWDANLTNESMSHPWGAVGLLAMQHYMLGVQAIKPQHELVRIKPLDFQDRLSSVRGLLPTDRGDLLISWNRNEDLFTMTLTIPDNVRAEVYIPKGAVATNIIEHNGKETGCTQDGFYLYAGEVGSGTHTFVRKMNQ